MVDAVIPTTKDPTIAPEGRHVMTCFVQYAPYRLKDEGWENGARRLAETVLNTIAQYAPNFRTVLEREVLTPTTFSGGSAWSGQHLPRRCRSTSCSRSGPRRNPPATGPRSRACTCAAPDAPGRRGHGYSWAERLQSGAKGLREQEGLVGEGSRLTRDAEICYDL